MQKRIFFLAAIIIIMFSVISCSEQDKSNPDTIGRAVKYELNEGEELLLRRTGVKHFFIYDLDINEDTDYVVDFWIDFYAGGKYQGKKLSGRSFLKSSDKDRRIYFTIHDVGADSEKWIIAAGSGALSTLLPHPEKTIGTSWESADAVRITKGEASLLAVIVKDKDRMYGIDKAVFTGDMDAFEEVMRHDYVYLFKCKIGEKNE